MAFDITQPYTVIADACGDKYYQQGGSLYSSSYPYAVTTAAICVPDSASAQVHGYLIPNYYVQDYGAAGDGTTDDSTSIQNAINAANAAGGGTVLLGAKTYYVPGGLTPKSNVTIRGQSINVSLDSLENIAGGTVLLGNVTNDCFAFNSTDSVAAQPTQSALLAARLSGFNIYDIGFKNFKRAIHFGSARNTGVWESVFKNLWATGCTEWGFYFENCSSNVYENLTVTRAGTGAIGCMGFMGSQTNWNHGNSQMTHLFAQPSTTLCRGIVFKATQGAKLNDNNLNSVQCNQGGAKVNIAGTTVTSSADIGVPDATQFPIDLPVTLHASANGFFIWLTYFVVARNLGANTIQLALMQGDTVNAIAATGNTGISIDCYGFPGLEFVGSGDASGSQIQMHTCYGVDSEGVATCNVLVQKSGLFLDITYIFTGQGTSNASSLCVRQSTGAFRSGLPITIDTDNAGRNFYSDGATLNTGGTEPKPIVQYAPLGWWRDGSGYIKFNLGDNPGGQTTYQSLAGQSALSTYFLYPFMSMGQKSSVSSSTTYTLLGSDAGAITYTGTTSTTWTLPTLTNGAGGSASATAGIIYEICNGSTTGGVVLTLAAGGTNNFGRQAAKTSYTMSLGASISIRANYDGSTPFWQVVGNNGAT